MPEGKGKTVKISRVEIDHTYRNKVVDFIFIIDIPLYNNLLHSLPFDANVRESSIRFSGREPPPSSQVHIR